LKRTTGGPASPADFAKPITSLARLIPVPANKPLAASDRALDQGTIGAEKLEWPRGGALHCGSRETDWVA